MLVPILLITQDLIRVALLQACSGVRSTLHATAQPRTHAAAAGELLIRARNTDSNIDPVYIARPRAALRVLCGWARLRRACAVRLRACMAYNPAHDAKRLSGVGSMASPGPISESRNTISATGSWTTVGPRATYGRYQKSAQPPVSRTASDDVLFFSGTGHARPCNDWTLTGVRRRPCRACSLSQETQLSFNR